MTKTMTKMPFTTATMSRQMIINNIIIVKTRQNIDASAKELLNELI
jgi:hypothetical protein